MGSGASTNVGSWTAQDVQEQVMGLGQAYEPYASVFFANGIDGQLLLSCSFDDIKEAVPMKAIHEKMLQRKFDELKACSVSPPSPVEKTTSQTKTSETNNEDQTESLSIAELIAKIVPSPPPTLSDLKECFHVFIGYRVATDSSLAVSLFDKLISLSAMKPNGKFAPDNALVRPYLDSKCLIKGEDWEIGFSNGLAKSRLFTPLLSWTEGSNGDPAGSIGGLAKLDPANGKDWCDNVLLEYEFALCIQEHRPSFFAILPILFGPADSRGYTEFPWAKLNMLSRQPSMKTKEKLVHHCLRQGIPVSAAALTRSIYDVVTALTKLQGILLWNLGSVAIATDAATSQVLDQAVSLLANIDPLSLGKEVKVVANVAPKRTLGSKADTIEVLKEAGSSPSEIWGKGYSLREIRTAGIRDVINNEKLLKLAEKEGVDCLVTGAIEGKSNDSNSDTLLNVLLQSPSYSVDTVLALIERGADIECQKTPNRSALLVAVEAQRLDAVKVLLKNSANANARDINGRTPLLLACDLGSLDIVKCIMDYVQEEEVKDIDGNNALHIACSKGHISVVEFLLSADCKEYMDESEVNNAGQSPVDIAAFYRQYDVLICLKQCRPAITLPDNICDLISDDYMKCIEKDNVLDLFEKSNPLDKTNLPITFSGHNKCVNSVFVYKDMIVSGSHDNTIKVWDLHSKHGKCLKTFTGHTSYVSAVFVYKDLIVSGSGDNTIKVWDLHSKESTCLRTFTGHRCHVSSLFVQNDLIISGSDIDNTIIVWDLHNNDGTCVKTFATKQKTYFPYKDLIVSGSSDESIKVLNGKDGTCLRTFVGQKNGVNSVFVYKDMIVSGASDNTIKVWDLHSNDNKCLRTFTGHTSYVKATFVYKDMIVSASGDNTIKVWDLHSNDNTCLRTFTGHKDRVNSVFVYKDVIVSGSHDYTIKVWDLRN